MQKAQERNVKELQEAKVQVMAEQLQEVITVNCSRSGAKHKAWFEGGQMPLQRRIPKLGFTNIFKNEYQVVNVDSLQKLVDSKKIKEGVLMPNHFKSCRLDFKSETPVKILGNGEIKAKLQIEVNAFSQICKRKN